MLESGLYVGVVVELHTGLETVVDGWYKKCPQCNENKSSIDTFCNKCGTKLIAREFERQCDYQQFLSNEDMFYELPVREANERGISYLASNLRPYESELDTSSPVSLLAIDMTAECEGFLECYKDELDRLIGFSWYVRYMAIEWAEY